MTKPIARTAMYRRRFFDAEVIELCVRWHITYRLEQRTASVHLAFYVPGQTREQCAQVMREVAFRKRGDTCRNNGSWSWLQA